MICIICSIIEKSMKLQLDQAVTCDASNLVDICSVNNMMNYIC